MFTYKTLVIIDNLSCPPTPPPIKIKGMVTMSFVECFKYFCKGQTKNNSGRMFE